MSRKSVLLSILALVLVLAIIIAPALSLHVQIDLTIHTNLGSSSLPSISPAAFTLPASLACEGCSGGGGGPF
jgi:hypothetical protein